MVWESEIPTTVRDIQIMDAVADQVEIAKKNLTGFFGNQP